MLCPCRKGSCPDPSSCTNSEQCLPDANDNRLVMTRDKSLSAVDGADSEPSANELLQMQCCIQNSIPCADRGWNDVILPPENSIRTNYLPVCLQR